MHTNKYCNATQEARCCVCYSYKEAFLEVLTSWWSLYNAHTLSLVFWWGCSNISHVLLTRCELRQSVAGVSGGGVDNHLTSDHVDHSQLVGETTENTSSWGRIPRDDAEIGTKSQVENLSNTCGKIILIFIPPIIITCATWKYYCFAISTVWLCN